MRDWVVVPLATEMLVLARDDRDQLVAGLAVAKSHVHMLASQHCGARKIGPMKLRTSFPTALELASEMFRMTGRVRQFDLREWDDDDCVHYAARCQCGSVIRVDCFEQDGVPALGFVASMLLTGLDRCGHGATP
jgi:hypothetical protein